MCGGAWREGASANHYTLLQQLLLFPSLLALHHDWYLLQVDQMLRGAPVDTDGNFDYVAFTRILKHGTKDE